MMAYFCVFFKKNRLHRMDETCIFASFTSFLAMSSFSSPTFSHSLIRVLTKRNLLEYLLAQQEIHIKTVATTLLTMAMCM